MIKYKLICLMASSWAKMIGFRYVLQNFGLHGLEGKIWTNGKTGPLRVHMESDTETLHSSIQNSTP